MEWKSRLDLWFSLESVITLEPELVVFLLLFLNFNDDEISRRRSYPWSKVNTSDHWNFKDEKFSKNSHEMNHCTNNHVEAEKIIESTIDLTIPTDR